MKEQIMGQLKTVQMALGNVYVHGEQSCLNLGGALQMLRELQGVLEGCDIQPTPGKEEQDAGV